MAERGVDTPAGTIKAGPYERVLQEMRERWDYATDAWADIRDEATTDMRYVSGDPWDNDDRQLRENAGRPVLAFDEFSQYVNQLINEIRRHKRAIKVTPVGYGANADLARFRQDLIRQIEYRSNAQQAYTTGFENTVQRSYGFWRVVPAYVNSPKASGGKGGGFDQELLIKSLPNPDLVTIDPDIQQPSGKDMQFAWIAESWALSDYKRKFPKAKIQDFNVSLTSEIPKSWTYEPNRIQVAEYWTIERTDRTLLLFTQENPETGQRVDLEVYEDDLDAPEWAEFAALKLEPVRSRVVDTPVVMQYLTNGFEILGAPTRWPGSTIPIVCCFGKILYLDEGQGTTKKILSLVRLARDPAMLLSYCRSGEAEQIGLINKIPWTAYRGQFNADELAVVQKSLHEPVAVLEFGATTEGLPPGTVLPPPQRNTMEAQIQSLEMAAESARRAIQAAMGISALPTSAQRKNEKSGVALQEIRDAEQQGSFHFIDRYEESVTRTGEIVEEVLDDFYDTARDVTIRTQTDEPKTVRINDPQALADGQEAPILLGQAAKFDVTLSTGPDFASEREEATAFADVLLQAPFGNLIADLAVKLRNVGPIGDEIAKRLHAVLPPAILALDQSKGHDPARLVGELQQLSQMVEQMSGELESRTRQIETEQVKAENALRIEVLKQEAETRRAELKTAADIQIRKIEVIAELLKTRATLEQRQTEAMIDAATGELDRAVEVAGAREQREAVSVEKQKDRDTAEASEARAAALARAEAAVV